MSANFVKLFSSITESTVWGESYATRLVWVTMLTMADSKGRVQASIPGLAHRARVTLAECEAALETFKQPDKYSRTPDHEGRRIEDIDGGWRLLNYLKYREMRDEDARREYQREWDRQNRQNRKSADKSDSDPTRSDKSDTIRPNPTKEDVDVEEETAKAKSPPTPRKRGDGEPSGFAEFWKPYPRKVSKPHAIAAWRKLKLDTQALPAILAGLERDRRSAQWQRDGGQFIPHPATWLNGRRWEDADATETPTTSEPAGFSLEDALSAQGVVQ